MPCKTRAVLLAIVLCTPTVLAQTQSSLLQKAQTQFHTAQDLERSLKQKPETDRARSEYLKVINAYERVYIITPRTSYADDALMAMARLYEEIMDVRAAQRTLNFLIREYPESPFR